MARLQIDDVANAVKDAAYVSVGLGVIAFQRLQVRRNELDKTLSEQAGTARSALDAVGALVGDRVKVVEERLSAVARPQLTPLTPPAAGRVRRHLALRRAHRRRPVRARGAPAPSAPVTTSRSAPTR